MLHTVTAGKKTSESGTVVECIVVTTVLELFLLCYIIVFIIEYNLLFILLQMFNLCESYFCLKTIFTKQSF